MDVQEALSKERPKCDICNKTFTKRNSLNRHKKSVHGDGPTFICHICGAQFTRMDGLLKHDKKHGLNTFKCTICDKIFSQKDNLTRHEKVHHSESKQLIMCKFCGKTLSMKDSLADHQAVCSQQRQQVPRSTCTSKELKTRGRCRNRLECCICEKVFTRKSSLKRHVDSHSKQYSCDICGKTWTRKDKVKTHSCPKEPSKSNGSRKSGCARVRKHRLKKQIQGVLLRSPKTKANYVQTLLDSPRTHKILEQSGDVLTKAHREKFECLEAWAKDQSDHALATKKLRQHGAVRYRQQSAAASFGPNVSAKKKTKKVARLLQYDRKTIKKIKKVKVRDKMMSGAASAWEDVVRKTRGCKIADDWKKVISDFWENDASHPTTDSTRSEVRKRIGKKEYLCHRKQIMTKTYREAFKMFRVKHPNVAISEVTFRRCKPFYVRPATSRDLEQCCCQKCVSVKKAFRAIENFKQKHNCDHTYGDLYSMIEATLCQKEEGSDFHKLECLKQECEHCGLSKLKFCEKEKCQSEDCLVTWYCFEYRTRKESKFLDFVKKETSPNILLEHLMTLLNGFAYHLFVAKWQRNQWSSLIQNLPADHVALEMDFSENFSSTMQEEAQSLHWSHPQVAIHSCVIWRPTVPEDNVSDSHVKEHWLLISDDLEHDYNFVHYSISEVIVPKLRSMDCKFSTIHQRTDGCGAQYKSKNAFGDVSSSKAYLNVKTFANFSASGHGKGEVDSAAGFLKTSARKAITANDADKIVIRSAADLYNFAEDTLLNIEPSPQSTLHRRRFFLIPENAVNRNRERPQYKTIAGTRKLHSVASVGVPGQLDIRELSCYCFNCVNSNQGCEHQDIVQPFKQVTFSDGVQADVSASTSTETKETEEEADEQYDLISMVVCRDSVVAIRPDANALYDFFLFHVTSEGVVSVQDLDDGVTDEFGHQEYPPGTRVVTGYYYEQDAGNPHHYKANPTSNAIIPKDCILYFGFELIKTRHGFKLSNTDYVDIMCAIAL